MFDAFGCVFRSLASVNCHFREHSSKLRNSISLADVWLLYFGLARSIGGTSQWLPRSVPSQKIQGAASIFPG